MLKYPLSARDSIETRREQVKQRRMRLAEAKAFHEDDLLAEVDAGVECAEERLVNIKSFELVAKVWP